MTYRDLNYLINDKQYGFLSMRSTSDLMTLVTEKWNQFLRNHIEAKVVAFDILKAFDSLAEFCALALHDKLNKWIESVLIGHCIPVVLDGVESELHSQNAALEQYLICHPHSFSSSLMTS